MEPLNEQFDTNQAADYLDYMPDTVRNGRHTGQLGGVPAPRYRKRGNRVFYEKTALDEWLEQFQEQTCTKDPVAKIKRDAKRVNPPHFGQCPAGETEASHANDEPPVQRRYRTARGRKG